jgi:hypothetical protein
MKEVDSTHPKLADLAAFAAGQLAIPEGQAIERHLSDCPECGQRFDGLPEDPFAALVRAAADASKPWPGPSPGSDAASTTPAELDGAAALDEVPAALAEHPRYRVLGRLGAGGMGVVFKAVHRMMDRVVAIKVPYPPLLERPGFLERFRQETRAAAQLVHPNIVVVHDAEEADLPFLVMECVPGMSLDGIVAQRGPLPVAEACDCARQAALGLQHAHEHGMIHCDVKPANLLRTPAGVVKVLDFGLTRLLRGDPTGATAGTLAGTPDYMAPEQIRDPAGIDARSDLYSLGATLYYLLTGRPPFAAGTALDKLLAHQDVTPAPIPDFRIDVPPDLLAILDRMLAKDRQRRPQTCAEVARLLAPFAGSAALTEPAQPRPIRRKRRRWVGIMAALGLALGIAALLFIRPWALPVPSGGEPPGTPESIAVAEIASDTQMTALKKQRREQALAWLRENNTWGASGSIVQHAAQEIDSNFDRLESFQLLVGAQLLRSSKPALLAGHPSGFFVFPLTEAQAKALQFGPTTLRWRGCRKAIDARRPAPRVHLSSLRFDHANQQPSAARLTGKVHYEVGETPVTGPYAVRITFYHRGLSHAGLIWFRQPPLQGVGELAFDCPAVGSYRDQPHGPLVFFAEIVTETDGRTIVESDACATLMDVAPPRP